MKTFARLPNVFLLCNKHLRGLIRSQRYKSYSKCISEALSFSPFSELHQSQRLLNFDSYCLSRTLRWTHRPSSLFLSPALSNRSSWRSWSLYPLLVILHAPHEIHPVLPAWYREAVCHSRCKLLDCVQFWQTSRVERHDTCFNQCLYIMPCICSKFSN